PFVPGSVWHEISRQAFNRLVLTDESGHRSSGALLTSYWSRMCSLKYLPFDGDARKRLYVASSTSKYEYVAPDWRKRINKIRPVGSYPTAAIDVEATSIISGLATVDVPAKTVARPSTFRVPHLARSG